MSEYSRPIYRSLRLDHLETPLHVLDLIRDSELPSVHQNTKTHSGPFHALLLTVLGPRGISMIDDPRSAFTCPSSTLRVLANSDPFRGLLLTILGTQRISTIADPLVEFTCLSSTLKVLANSDPFSGLLLTVLVSRSDFHSC